MRSTRFLNTVGSSVCAVSIGQGEKGALFLDGEIIILKNTKTHAHKIQLRVTGSYSISSAEKNLSVGIW